MLWNGLQCYLPLQISAVLTVCIFKRAEFATYMGTGSILQDLVKNPDKRCIHFMVQKKKLSQSSLVSES